MSAPEGDWTTVPASAVRPGDRVRMPRGELLVTRVDDNHLGVPGLLKFVEDTDERWLCFVTMKDGDVEVQRDPARP